MKKRMILALVLVLALLCLACSNDADDGASSSESVSVAETSTNASAESTSSADEMSSVENDTSSETSGTTSVDGTSTESDTSSESSTGTESSATSSDASTPSKPAENSENSKPTEGSENSDTSSGSGNPNPSQTGHKHSYKTTVVKPTCTEDGYTLHKCSCGDSYTDNEVPATGHEYQIERILDPTQTKRGERVLKCIRCNDSLTEELYSLNELSKLTADRVLYWLNKYRAEDGAGILTVSNKLNELSEYRAQQALQGGSHAGHNSEDEESAAAATKCGTFFDLGEGKSHWTAAGIEAYGSMGLSFYNPVGDSNSIDSVAQMLVDGFRSSAPHWIYVGGQGDSYKNFIYAGIGISRGGIYVTVCDYNPDEKGYEHYYYDENGKYLHEWVKE